ncbi:MAG: hypothetical protein GXY36_01630 [Chloroflexi bacterium]|nr:hypothetical protein [Chloroflexota bacterium]
MTTVFRVEIDWNHDGTWTDETPYTRHIWIRSGFERPGDLVAGVGRCRLTLDNTSRRFSPGAAGSPLYGRLLPRRAVRVRAFDGAESWTLFRGVIERITPQAGAWCGGEVTLEAVDGIALLARQSISLSYASSQPVDAVVAAVVSAAYTPPAADYHANGDTLAHVGRAWPPEQTSALDALRTICAAVHGRFFVARDGTAVFLTRADLQRSQRSPVPVVGAEGATLNSERRAGLEIPGPAFPK